MTQNVQFQGRGRTAEQYSISTVLNSLIDTGTRIILKVIYNILINYVL